MEMLRNWVGGICMSSLLVAVIGTLAPKNAMVKMCSAMLLVIAILAPVKKIDFSVLRLDTYQIENELSEKIKKIDVANQKMQDNIIERELIEYICNRAEISKDELRIDCSGGEVREIVLYKNDKKVIEFIERECGVARENIVISAKGG